MFGSFWPVSFSSDLVFDHKDQGSLALHTASSSGVLAEITNQQVDMYTYTRHKYIHKRERERERETDRQTDRDRERDRERKQTIRRYFFLKIAMGMYKIYV